MTDEYTPNPDVITLFSQPSCGPCRGVESALINAGAEYEKVDISADSAAADHLRSLGYTGTPVLMDREEHFKGFDPGKMKAMIERNTLIKV